MTKIEYTEADQHGLDMVGPLWQKLREHHKMRSQHFAGVFEKMTFNQRKKELLDKSAKGVMRIDFAKDAETGELVGYCVSTISGDKQGEIDSIYIEAGYRRGGIGDTFMKRALNWMESQSVKKKVIGVAGGNEEVFPFYRRYGFFPRVTILGQAGPGEAER